MGLLTYISQLLRNRRGGVRDQARARQLRYLEGSYKEFMKRPDEEESPPVVEDCLHASLRPSWDSLAEVGNEDSVSAFTCDACLQRFTPVQASEMRVALEPSQGGQQLQGLDAA